MIMHLRLTVPLPKERWNRRVLMRSEIETIETARRMEELSQKKEAEVMQV
jgi:hypothetical protein